VPHSVSECPSECSLVERTESTLSRGQSRANFMACVTPLSLGGGDYIDSAFRSLSAEFLVSRNLYSVDEGHSLQLVSCVPFIQYDGRSGNNFT
jgi:hypothetical protein